MQMYIKKGKAPYWMSKIRQSQTVLNCKEKYKADKLSPGPSLFSPTHQVPRVLQKGSGKGKGDWLNHRQTTLC